MERFLDYFVPEKYALDLAIDKDAKIICGIVTVTGEAVREDVKFHAVDLDIMEVMVNGRKTDFKTDGKELTISKVPLGKIEIIIYYNGKLNENMEGAYLSTYEYEGKTEVLVATQFESHYARQAFPCIDEPAAKAIFELMIGIPERGDDVIIANMPVAYTGENSHGVRLRR